MRNLRDLLFPPKPAPVVDDPLLGRLTWDAWTKSWISPLVPPAGCYDFQIDRFARLPIPPAEALTVAYELVGNPENLAFSLRVVLELEAENSPPSIRADILRLGITRISLRMRTGSVVGVVGEMTLDGKPPLARLFCWHSNGTPVGIGQHWE